MRRLDIGSSGLWRDFLRLLGLLTIIPVPRGDRGLELGSLYLISLIGFIKGLFVVSPLLIIILLGSNYAMITTSLVIAIHYIIQGFLHADGLIDFGEALLASRFGADPYKLMKDAHRGSYAIALFGLFIVALYSSLYTMLITSSFAVAIIMIISAEMISLISALYLSYIGGEPPEGMGRIFKRSIRRIDLFISFLISIAIIILISYILLIQFIEVIITLIKALIPMLLSISTTYYLSKKILGFVNGDVLGFCIELSYLMIIILGALL